MWYSLCCCCCCCLLLFRELPGSSDQVPVAESPAPCGAGCVKFLIPAPSHLSPARIQRCTQVGLSQATQEGPTVPSSPAQLGYGYLSVYIQEFPPKLLGPQVHGRVLVVLLPLCTGFHNKKKGGQSKEGQHHTEWPWRT